MTRQRHIIGPQPTTARLVVAAIVLMACLAAAIIGGLELAGVPIWHALLTEIGLRP